MISTLNFSSAPKGLGGRFLTVNDTVKENDLVNYSLFHGVRAGWKQAGASGRVVDESRVGWFYRPNEAYSVDESGYYVTSQRNKDAIEAEVVEEPEKPKYTYNNLVKNDYNTLVEI